VFFMESEKAKESEKATKESLLEHYSNETCSHIESAIALFFGLIGTLILMTVVNTVLARAVFTLTYFLLGLLGLYFYVRLFYYRKMLEEILFDEPFREWHIRFQGRIFKESKLIRLTQWISRTEKGYRLNWAWIMLALAVVVAILSWIIVFFSPID